MKLLRRLRARLSGMFRPSFREHDFSAELQSHLQLAIDDLVRQGVSPGDARRQALMDLGGVEQTRQRYREANTLPLLENLVHDTRFTFRQLRKDLGFTLTAILMLALGVAASVAIFAFVDAALLKPLPYTDPARLVGVFESISLGPHFNLSYLDYLDWKRDNTVFSSLDAYQRTGFFLDQPSGVVPVRGARVSDGFFRTLGVQPILGRNFAPGEDLPSAPRTAILTYTTWIKRFNGRPDVLGRTVSLDRQPTIIVGVLPRSFQFAPVGSPEFFTTLHANGSCDLRRSCHSMYGIARLKPGVTLSAATENLVSIAAHLESIYPQDNRGQSASTLPLSEYIVGDIRPTLLLLLGGASLLLLIASINVSSLLLVRTESRRREIALRSALGASRARIARQFVTEALVLVLAGTTLGIALAAAAMRLLLHLIPSHMLDGMPYLQHLGLNPRILVFAAAVGLAALALFAITPFLRVSYVRIASSLAEGSRGNAGTTWRHFASHLVVLELATATILLVGAGLLGKSLYRLLHVHLGINPDHLATLSIAAPAQPYSDDAKANQLARRILDQASALPGVRSVALTTGIPLSGAASTEWVRILGRPWHGEHLEMLYRDISPAYFSTLGASLHSGRSFTDQDTLAKPRVAIINQAFARTWFPNEDPVGHQLSHTSVAVEPPIEIVGVVNDLREGSLDEPIAPVLYLPFAQNTDTFLGLLVRTSGPERDLLPPLVRSLHEIDPDLILEDPGTFANLLSNSPSAYLHRSVATLVGVFATLALLLGVVGLYGLIAYSVSQRTREIGVRMALGAPRSSVYRIILTEAGTLAAAGILLGLLGSVAAAQLLRQLLFHVHAWDISTLTLVAATLATAALLGSLIPAHRAASINPVDALRAE